MTSDLNSPVVLITGALAGIGRATALAFAKTRAKVVVSGRRPQGRRRPCGRDSQTWRRGGIHRRRCQPRRRRAPVDRGCRGPIWPARYRGELRRHRGSGWSYYRIDPRILRRSLRTNVLGLLLSLKYELRAMQTQNSGSIINLSSTFGRIGGAQASLYSASKHAVEGLTKVSRPRGRPLRRSRQTPWRLGRSRLRC